MGDFFRRLRMNYSTFMQGRYGMDELNRTLLIAAVVLFILKTLLRLRIFSLLAWLALIVMAVRALSRNAGSRLRENAWWATSSVGLRKWFGSIDRKWRDRKTTLYFTCKECGAELSVPRGKGKVRVVCPNCGKETFKNT